MGAWGTDTFENDTAGDWADALPVKGIQHVKAALDNVLAQGSNYLEADIGCEGLAACDVLARMRGKFGQRDAYTEEVDAWVQAQTVPPAPELIAQALAVIDRVTAENSELAALWDETDSNEEWRRQVAALRGRLTS